MSRHDDRPEALPAEFREALERAADELFVGRGRELLQLDAALNDALGGRGRMLLVAGEPGIGKTRLTERVAAGATERGASVLWGRCWEGEGAPAFWPWVQVIRSYMRSRDVQALAAELGIGAPYVAQVVPEVREILPDVPAAPPLDSEQARFRLYDSFAAFFRKASGRSPLVLVLDDLHWADKSSLLLLQFLAREIGDARVLVLGTYRDVEVTRGSPLAEALPALRRERTVERIPLRGLSEDEVQAMLAALGRTDVPGEFATEIARETGGNPFFIKEIGRHLLDEGIADREGDQWVRRIAPEEVRLPESVREVIGRRLSRLGAHATRLLTVAAVVGQEFGLDLLERAAGLPREALIEALEEAVSARVVDEVPQAIGRYRFSHTLIRETLYQELRTLERVRLHGRIGKALEALFAANPEAHLAELAHHFLESLPGGDVAKAVDYATRAGDRAAAQLAYEQAALLYGRALQALELAGGSDERLRCELLLKLGEAQWSAGGFANPSEALQEAAELAGKLGQAELLARAALSLGGPAIWLATAEREIDWLTKARAALADEDTALRARVTARLAARRHFREEVGALARPALEMARRIGDKATLAYVLNLTPWATWGPDDDLDERLELTDEMIRLAEGVGDHKLAAEGRIWRAAHYLEIGDIDAAERDLDAQLRVAQTSRQPYHRWLSALVRTARTFLEGRLDEAEGLYREAMAAGADLWGKSTVPVLIPLDRGVGPALRQALQPPNEQDIATYELLRGRTSRVTWAVALTWVFFRAGRVEEARRTFDRLAAEYAFSEIPRDLQWLDSISRLSEIAALLGDAAQASILYDLLQPYASRCAVRAGIVCLGSVARPLGLLATTLSRFDDAERHFHLALEVNARMRAGIWVAQTQHDYARMLLARSAPGDRERAAALLEQALATAQGGGMKMLEREILDTIAETGLAVGAGAARTPGRPAAESAFRRDHGFWTIVYDGQSLRLKDSKGLQYVAELLRLEGDEIHAADLAAGSAPGEATRDLGHSGEILDAQARAEYRDRLRDLEADLEEATRWSDVGRAARLQEEIEFLKDELSAAFGVGGRARKAGDTTERARKAVASRIRDAIEKIGKQHRALALHLENAIRTGAFCSYRPDRSPGWSFESGGKPDPRT